MRSNRNFQLLTAGSLIMYLLLIRQGGSDGKRQESFVLKNGSCFLFDI